MAQSEPVRGRLRDCALAAPPAPRPPARPPGVRRGGRGLGGGAEPRLPRPTRSAELGKQGLQTPAQPDVGFRRVSPTGTRKVTGAVLSLASSLLD